MRPYLNWHGDPDRLNRYINKPDAEPIGGTIPNFGSRNLFQRFRALAIGDPRPEPIMHMTLSLPKGTKAPRRIWLKVIKAAMKIIGLDPEMTPWFSKRHRDSDCDHVHTAIVLRDFAGRPLHVSGSEAKAEEAHRHLCEMLGLPAPVYFDAAGPSRLDPVTPERRTTKPHPKALHRDLQSVFHNQQPESLYELNTALSNLPGGFQVEMAPNAHGVPAFKFSSVEGSIFGGALGKGWEPRHLQNLLHFTGKLRRFRDTLDLDQLVWIFKKPKMENIVAKIIDRPNPARTSSTPGDYSGTDQDDGQTRPRPARSSGPSEPTRRPERVPRRNAPESAPEPHRSTGAISRRTHQSDHADERYGREDREGGRENTREPMAAGPEAGQATFDTGQAPRGTLGALLAKVCGIAAKRLPGWKVRVLPNSQKIGIAFTDRSAAIVDQYSATVMHEGEEALTFQADYALTIEPPEQDTEIRTEPDF